jgi:arylsulfatase
MTAPLTFTANDCLDIEYGWGSPRSTEYFDDALYKFEGTLGTTTISYSDK